MRELELVLPIVLKKGNILQQLREAVRFRVPPNVIPLRFSIINSTGPRVQCSISALEIDSEMLGTDGSSIFRFVPRKLDISSRFNVVLLVPTGIGAEIGGHAGDATPTAQLMAEACDTLILHPNVVNASDINEMPTNSLYVEGSVITRLMMGTAGLVPVRANRVLVIIDYHEDEMFVNATVNAVSAARASYGLNCPEIVKMSPSISMISEFTKYGTATGKINGIERIISILNEKRGDYDAVALSSIISVPEDFHKKYFDAAGKMVNPWGGVEAMLTHAISSRFNIPSAHSPMLETRRVADIDPGIVDPRMAAEAISVTFLESVLKGLQKSPRIVSDSRYFVEQGVISAANVSCLVIPDGCIGLPTLAALEQNIPVIAVRENRNLMKNDLKNMPWRSGQFHMVENYWEAAGVLCAIRGGITPGAVRRPLKQTMVSERIFADKNIRQCLAKNDIQHGQG